VNTFDDNLRMVVLMDSIALFPQQIGTFLSRSGPAASRSSRMRRNPRFAVMV